MRLREVYIKVLCIQGQDFVAIFNIVQYKILWIIGLPLIKTFYNLLSFISPNNTKILLLITFFLKQNNLNLVPQLVVKFSSFNCERTTLFLTV